MADRLGTLESRTDRRMRFMGASAGEDPAKNALYNLVRSDPDLLLNRFTAVLFWYGTSRESAFKSMSDSREAGALDNMPSSSKAQSILTKEGFYVRLGEIEVPLPRNETFELSVGETSIQKIRSSKTIEKHTNFTFRLDDNLEWIDFFNKTAGENVSVKEKPVSKSKIFEYNFIEKPTDIRDCVSFVARSFSFGSTKDLRLSLAVCSDDFSPQYMQRERKSSWYYLFEDIRILGVDSSIDYSQDNSGPTDATISFIYRNVVRLDLNDIIVS